MLLPSLSLYGAVDADILILGGLLLPAYFGGSLLGKAWFVPARAGLYRGIAYGIIGISGILGLPILT